MKYWLMIFVSSACVILFSCTSVPSSQEGGVATAWGPVTNGVSCGLGLSKESYVLGEEIGIHVLLKNTRAEAITCKVSTIQSCKLKQDGVLEMHLIVDAIGGQYPEGASVRIPPGQTIRILSQAFPTRPAGNRMSDIHFRPGSTPILVVCTPVFQRKEGPLLAGEVSGTCSGVVKVKVSKESKIE